MKKSRISTLLLFCALLAGLSLLLYPTLSDYWNSLHQSRAITQYAQEVTDLNAQRYAAMLESAHQYNRALLTKADRFEMSEAEQAEYAAQLDVSGTGIIGYIEIPEIKCSLPIYHGVDEAVLQIAVGHIAGTSLPVGGESTHCVLSGHRGLPSARLFTDLDRLEEGDLFMIRVLNETLTYEVDQIRIVEPQEMGELEIEEGKDYCTLITCTPLRRQQPSPAGAGASGRKPPGGGKRAGHGGRHADFPGDRRAAAGRSAAAGFPGRPVHSQTPRLIYKTNTRREPPAASSQREVFYQNLKIQILT